MNIVKFYVGEPDAPKTNRPAHLGVNVLLLCSGKLLMEQRRDCARWGLPGGGARHGETLRGAIVRELYEETRLRIPEKSFLPLKFYDTPSRIAAYRDGSVWKMYVKLFALTLTAEPVLALSAESKQMRFFSAAELKTLDIVETHRDMVRDYLWMLSAPSAQDALAFLERAPLQNIDMLEPLRRGHVNLLYAGEDGVLLRERNSGVPMISTDGEATARLLLPMLAGTDTLVVHHPHEHLLAQELLHLDGENPCYQCIYPDIPQPPVWGDVRRLDESFLPQVAAHYHLMSDPEYARELLCRGEMFGQFVDGALAAFIGTHEEGSIGLLEVFEPYRRQGIGQNLIRFMISHWRGRGATPYSQVIYTNEKSIRLQKKLGAVLSETLIWWMWRRETRL
jgi:tRNA (guanine37-N1)-methyltransferase